MFGAYPNTGPQDRQAMRTAWNFRIPNVEFRMECLAIRNSTFVIRNSSSPPPHLERLLTFGTGRDQANRHIEQRFQPFEILLRLVG